MKQVDKSCNIKDLVAVLSDGCEPVSTRTVTLRLMPNKVDAMQQERRHGWAWNFSGCRGDAALLSGMWTCSAGQWLKWLWTDEWTAGQNGFTKTGPHRNSHQCRVRAASLRHFAGKEENGRTSTLRGEWFPGWFGNTEKDWVLSSGRTTRLT